MPLRIPPVVALLVDALLVVAFAAVGRATHDGDVLGPAGSGLATTAWPFLVALLVAWVALRAWRRPTAAVRTGLPVWAITLAGGIALRAASGQGVAPAFVVVAALTLLLLIAGWRALAQLGERAGLREPGASGRR